MSEITPLWPAEASTYSHQVDLLFAAFTGLVVLLSAPVFILIIWFAIKYRRGKPANRKHAPDRNTWFEVSWSLIPFFLIIGFYVWSTDLFAKLYEPPANVLPINVVAKQWMWKFEHPGGQREINELHIPVGKPVELTMASQDVIHSLFLPSFRIKQDVVPGRYTHLWFTADRPGTYMLACAEFCGAQHSEMGGSVIVLKESDYARWLSEADVDQTEAQRGASLFRSHGCSGCHGAASKVHAPHLEGLYGRPVPLADGSVVTADEGYIRDSILLPQKQVAAGYKPIMPTFQNVLSEAEVLDLVAYIKSLASKEQPGS